MRQTIQRFGLNYTWGLLNFTAGVIGGGVFVALALIAHGLK